MKKLYKFYWNCGRMGDLEGLFVADEIDIEAAIGSEIYFGDVLGKHSDIGDKLSRGDLKVKSEDQELIDKLVELFGGNNISGYNPLDYISEDENNEEDE